MTVTSKRKGYKEGEKIYRRFIKKEVPEPRQVLDWTGKKRKPTILVFYTGGTLGMKKKRNKRTGKLELKPDLTLENLLTTINKVVSIKKDYNIIGYHISSLDSTEINVQVWENIGKLIMENYENVDGVVGLGGTDTMHYTAAATAFMFRNPSIPIVYTGGQCILNRFGTDVIMNVTSAIHLAGEDIAEVVVNFNNDIHLGSRVLKVRDDEVKGFESPMYGRVGYIGGQGLILDDTKIHPRGAHISSNLVYSPGFDKSVLEFSLNPGTTPALLEAAVSTSDCKAVVISSYGPGNAARWFAPQIKEYTEEGIPVFIASQCPSGITGSGSSYEVGSIIIEAGAVPLRDMLPHDAAVKVMKIMADEKDCDTIKDLVVNDVYANEITSLRK